MSAEPACPVCGGARGEVFFRLAGQPVLIGVLWASAELARRCPRGDIDLAFCPDCGFIWNVAFDPSRIDYDQRYDNSLHFSPTFQTYTRELVDRLVRTYGLRRKRIVDIGCGKGDFLALLCEEGENCGWGFDPSYEGARVETPAAARITWSNDYYDERHSRIQADLIASRFVYEHIPAPHDFLRMIRRNIADPARTRVYFEVPDVDLIIRQSSIWDIIYEHCSFFSIESLTRSFAECGFDVLRVAETFGGQYLAIDARAADGVRGDPGAEAGDLSRLRADVAAFSNGHATKLANWHAQIAEWRKQGTRVVAWGAGAKAVGFLNMLQLTHTIARVVDVNPHKHGRYLAGTGQRIVAPVALRDDPPDVVVLMNPIYRDEIAATLRGFGLEPELVAA